MSIKGSGGPGADVATGGGGRGGGEEWFGQTVHWTSAWQPHHWLLIVVLLLIPPLPVAGVAVAVRVAVFVADRGELSTLGQVGSISKNFLVSDTLALVLLAERIATREATPSDEAQSYQKNHQEDENSQRKSNIESDVTGRGC